MSCVAAPMEQQGEAGGQVVATVWDRRVSVRASEGEPAGYVLARAWLHNHPERVPPSAIARPRTAFSSADLPPLPALLPVDRRIRAPLRRHPVPAGLQRYLDEQQASGPEAESEHEREEREQAETRAARAERESRKRQRREREGGLDGEEEMEETSDAPQDDAAAAGRVSVDPESLERVKGEEEEEQGVEDEEVGRASGVGKGEESEEEGEMADEDDVEDEPVGLSEDDDDEGGEVEGEEEEADEEAGRHEGDKGGVDEGGEEARLHGGGSDAVFATWPGGGGETSALVGTIAPSHVGSQGGASPEEEAAEATDGQYAARMPIYGKEHAARMRSAAAPSSVDGGGEVAIDHAHPRLDAAPGSEGVFLADADADADGKRGGERGGESAGARGPLLEDLDGEVVPMEVPGGSPLAAHATHPSATPADPPAEPAAEACAPLGWKRAVAYHLGSAPALLEGRGARARRPPAWSREPPEAIAEEKKRWANANQPLGRRKVAGSGSWHASQLDAGLIWKAHQAHWRRVKQHARARYAATLGRHKTRLCALLGLDPSQMTAEEPQQRNEPHAEDGTVHAPVPDAATEG